MRVLVSHMQGAITILGNIIPSGFPSYVVDLELNEIYTASSKEKFTDVLKIIKTTTKQKIFTTHEKLTVKLKDFTTRMWLSDVEKCTGI